MNTNKKIEWVLRIAIFGEFLGHGVFALQGKEQWVGWIQQLIGVNSDIAVQLLFCIGLLDIAIACITLLRPIRAALLWAAVWGFWTALLRPLVGEPVWDFVERWANWGAPLALLYFYGMPKTTIDWFRKSRHL